MLIGEYIHTLDPKKRVSLPAKFRKELGTQVVITRGLDNCLSIHSMKAWAEVARKIAELPTGQADNRGYSRFVLTGAAEVDVDSAGRILIPDFLKEFARLKEKIVMVGVQTRVEVWDADQWNAYKERIERQADAMAEKLGEFGVL